MATDWVGHDVTHCFVKAIITLHHAVIQLENVGLGLSGVFESPEQVSQMPELRVRRYPIFGECEPSKKRQLAPQSTA